jgi:P-type Mg2+ transporter
MNPQNPSLQNANAEDSSNALIDIAQKDVDGVLKLFDTSLEGLTETEAQRRLAK